MKEQIDKSIGKSMEEETIEATTKGGAAAGSPSTLGAASGPTMTLRPMMRRSQPRKPMEEWSFFIMEMVIADDECGRGDAFRTDYILTFAVQNVYGANVVLACLLACDLNTKHSKSSEYVVSTRCEATFLNHFAS